MKRLMALVMLMLLLPALACAQGLDAGLEQALGQVDLAPLETAAREDNLRVYLLRLAKGEMIWDARQVLDTLLRRLYGEARSSFSRMMGLLAPALLASAAGLLGGKRKDVIRIAESACFLALAATIAADMQHQDAPGTTFKRHMQIAKGVLNEDNYLLQEILFNPYTHDSVVQIRTELKELLEIIDNKDADGMRKYLKKIRNNVKSDIEINRQ